MADNKGVRGPASLRFRGVKVSELPFAEREGIMQLMPSFIEEQRRIKIDRIIARYPRGQIVQYEAAIRECEANIKTFARAKNDCMANIGKYMGLMQKREGDLTQEEVDAMTSEIVQKFIETHQANPEIIKDGRPIPGTLMFKNLQKKLDEVNQRLRLYIDEELWKQVGQFQEERDRYDEAAAKETESIFELRDAINQIRDRDRQIQKALSEPISVE